MLLGDLLDLHDVGSQVDGPYHADTDTFCRVLDVLVKLGEVDSVLREGVCHSVPVDQLLELLLCDDFESALGVNEVEEDLLELGIEARLVPVRVEEVKQVLQPLLLLALAQPPVHGHQILAEFVVDLRTGVKQHCLS